MNKQKTAIEIAEAGRTTGNLDRNIMHIVIESNTHVLHFYKSVPLDETNSSSISEKLF
jgi:Ni,Fe-hydrogenase I large subunit